MANSKNSAERAADWHAAQQLMNQLVGETITGAVVGIDQGSLFISCASGATYTISACDNGTCEEKSDVVLGITFGERMPVAPKTTLRLV
jgi:hypothetical protein